MPRCIAVRLRQTSLDINKAGPCLWRPQDKSEASCHSDKAIKLCGVLLQQIGRFVRCLEHPDALNVGQLHPHLAPGSQSHQSTDT